MPESVEGESRAGKPPGGRGRRRDSIYFSPSFKVQPEINQILHLAKKLVQGYREESIFYIIIFLMTYVVF